jgi:TonB family protein
MREGKFLALLLLVPPSSAALAQQTYELPSSKDQPAPKAAPVLTKTPSLLKFVQAAYPKEAEEAGIGGEVGLEVDIAVDGSVSAARVVKPAGHGFDEAALDAVRQFVFSPAELDGKPAAVTIGYTYHFVLAKLEPPKPAPSSGRATVKLLGVVLEKGSKKPLDGVEVQVDGAVPVGGELLTDTEGRFALVLPVGPHRLTLFAAGYESLEKDVALEEGRDLSATFYLRPKIVGLFQTVVKAKPDSDVVVSYTLDRTEIRYTPGTFGDPLKIIQDLPGVARSPFDIGLLVVRGADPYDTNVYIDGIQIPQIYHLGGGPAVISPELVQQLDFYPGGQGARYGHGIGGVVDLQTRRLTPDRRVHALVDLNLAFAQAFLEVPIGDNWVVAAAGRRSYFDLIIKPFLGSGTTVVPYFWDYQLKVDEGRPGDKNTFGLFLYGSNDTLNVLSQNFAGQAAPLTVNYNTQFHRLVPRWSYHDGRFTSTLRLEFGTENLHFSTFGNSAGGTLNTLGMRHDMSSEVSPTLKLNFGEEIRWNSFSVSARVPAPQDYLVFPGSAIVASLQDFGRVFPGLDVGPWVEAVIKLPRNITLIPGLRFDFYDWNHQTRASVNPRLVLRWALTDRLTVKGSVGLYSEPPPILDLDMQFGTPTLQLLWALQFSAGFEYLITPSLHLEMTGYYNHRWGLVNGFLGPVPPGQTAFDNNGVGQTYGLEVYLKQDITPRIFGWLSYTLSRAEYASAPNQPWGVTAFDETHILAAVLSYNLGAGFILGGRFRLVTGTPFTPVATATYDVDANLYVPLYGPSLSARHEIFRQLDIRLDKEWIWDTVKLDVYIDIWNVTNTANEEFRIYDYRYRSSAILPSYPILPLLGVRVEY